MARHGISGCTGYFVPGLGAASEGQWKVIPAAISTLMIAVTSRSMVAQKEATSGCRRRTEFAVARRLSPRELRMPQTRSPAVPVTPAAARTTNVRRWRSRRRWPWPPIRHVEADVDGGDERDVERVDGCGQEPPKPVAMRPGCFPPQHATRSAGETNRSRASERGSWLCRGNPRAVVPAGDPSRNADRSEGRVVDGGRVEDDEVGLVPRSVVHEPDEPAAIGIARA